MLTGHNTLEGQPKSNSSRIVLAVGFGGLLTVMALSGVEALLVLGQVRKEDDQIRRQFLSRNHTLNSIRSQLYLSGTLVRDYLLDPDPARAEGFGVSLKDVRSEMERSLAVYDNQVEPSGTAPYRALRFELSRYWAVLAPILQWNASDRRKSGYSFLRDEVFPRREAMLAIAGQIESLNEQQLDAGNSRVVSLLDTFQKRLAITLLATLALGLGMAGFSIRGMLRLEAHSNARLAEVEEARHQLTNLSARLVEAQEVERRSLSRELHDEVGQSLSAVLVEVRNLSSALAAGSGRPLQQAETIKGLVENTVRVIRSMALLLRPSMLDDLGLVPALRWQARETSKRTGMDVGVVTELASDDLPDEFKTCIYRVVQEALHNCSRHSGATTVRIRVEQLPASLSLTIQDDGKGFDVQETKGLGLLGIEERAARLGGSCRVHSGPGIGTILSLELPFAGAAQGSVQKREADPHTVGG